MPKQKNSKIDGSTKQFGLLESERPRSRRPEHFCPEDISIEGLTAEGLTINPEQSRRIDLSISLVSFNTKSLLEQCLYSIFKNSKKLKLEVFVVDNASTDGTPEMIKQKFPKVKLVENSKNLFFHQAANLGLKKNRGKYVLILNPDTIIPKGGLQKMSQFMETHTKAAIASCRQEDGQGNIDKTCSRFSTPLIEFFESSLLGRVLKNQKLLSDYRYGNWKRNTVRKVDVIPGSFVFARRLVFEKLGGFDENLLLFFGENDLCLRTKKLGYSVYHNSDVTITHFRAQSIKKLPKWQLYQIVEHDMLTFYKKYFGFGWWLFLWLSFRPNWLYWKTKALISR